MITLEHELKKNFLSFNPCLKDTILDSYSKLELYEDNFFLSYKRLSSLQAWRVIFLENIVDSNVLIFFIESQNDALMSYTLARLGSWRSALQSLRCSIENVLFFLYYKDHPVEFELWGIGKHKIPISDYINYIEKHPKFLSIDSKISGISLLKKEYSTLSKAVHGSSINFIMTKTNEFPALMLPEKEKLNQWLSRECKTLQIINQILITFFGENLQGAKLRSLRKSISFSIPSALHDSIKNILGIRLFEL